ncbi:MAG TPA: hypothetical protein PKD24_06975 [Pyrinomonadaceae bacterium]|nr:hypothetical protein [Pyrinomonadaceae bacterium]HMP65099.1 hypothetical protein [Pyrinomonadaceae bacterium]
MKNASELPGKGKTGVSLHCHTEHSKEMLDFLPHYAEKLPIIAQFWRRERKNYIKREGRGIDFSTAHWSPPLSAKDVYDIEKRQINDAGLDAIISLTDHDSIEANLIVNEAAPEESAPISMEWTVPYEYGFFHVGVHNLPKDRAIDITKTLLDFTFVEENQTNERLTELLDMLWEMPGVLVVLNHPLWDIELVGQERHEELLRNFIRTHGRWIHAFEINGFRSWSENKAVIEMAESLGIPIATGGDRHGCKPNTVINLTNADTFEGFVDEIRNEKRSEVVLMPEYKHPLHWRQMQSFSEILKFYPEFREGRKKWFDRVHFDIGDGHGVRPLSVHWERGGPAWLRVAIWTLGVLGGPRMRPIFRVVRKKADRVPRDVSKAEFDIRPMDEIIPELSTGSPA